MKKLTIVFSICFVLSSCEILQDNNFALTDQVRNSSELADALISQKSLYIVNFIEEGRNKTSQFSDWKFSFKADGTVLASMDNIIINGSYQVFLDDGRLELKMGFPSYAPLYELDDDWYFETKTPNTLAFEDSEDRLVFQF